MESGKTLLNNHRLGNRVGSLSFFLCLSVENPIFFKHRVDQKYLLYIHEVKDACIRDLKNNFVFRVFAKHLKLKKISTIKDFQFGLHILPTLKSENCTFQLFEYISTSYYNLCVSSI